MTEVPNSWDDVTLRHKIAYYTFLPAMVFGVGIILGSFPYWYFYADELIEVLWVQWVGMWFVTSYLWTFGDYVMPRETYRKYRSGEWGETKEVQE